MRRPHCFSIISKFLLSFYKGHSTRTCLEAIAEAIAAMQDRDVVRVIVD